MPSSQFQNAPFCPISAADDNFNPRNIQNIPVVKIFAFPRSKSGIFDLTSNKIERFETGSVDRSKGFDKARRRKPVWSI